MKRSITFLAMALVAITMFGQSTASKDLLAGIEGQWELDDNQNVTYIRVVELPGMPKNDIYNRALDYFTYNYGSGKSVIQEKSIEEGRVVGKGLYSKVHTGLFFLVTVEIETWHIVRVDVKDGKARILLTMTQYEQTNTDTDGRSTHSTNSIGENFPINKKGGMKNIMVRAFVKSHERAIETLDKIETSLKEGNTSKGIENDDWK